ncbi:hypothetical protein HYV83_02760 [Candidatus Woesearchaeota archaeon]|nr:hypothetical protein [Candidatus Woesearchaeota archaeon]
MDKLPNRVYDLRSFWMPDGTSVRGAKLFEVSRFWPTKKLSGTSIDNLLAAEFELQQSAVSAGLINPGAELQPKNTKEILEDKTEKAYTVTAITVPEKNNLGYKVVAMVRPDVAMADGFYYVKLWFTPIVHPDFKGAMAGESRKISGPLLRTLDEFLMHTAIDRARDFYEARAAELNRTYEIANLDLEVFADDQGSMKVDELRKYGFGVLLDKVGVPDLSATGSALYKPVYESTVMLKTPNQRVMLNRAIEMVQDYQHNGYGVPLTARMVKDATRRLEERAREIRSNLLPLT